MVSPLWKACSDGDLHKAIDALNDASALDIELKDHTGATPLIEAVRNGHIELVRLLLEKGADPANASSQGRPEQYTSDPAILELLHSAQARAAPSENGVQQGYPPATGSEEEKRFYGQDAYTYYPTINPSLSTVNEGGAYYGQTGSAGDASPNGAGHLPPPEVARMIPCRYFPACRYGAQCMFAHPQTPYFQAPMAPQYPPFEQMGAPYMPQYYQPPPAFPPPMSPPPGPPIMHARSPSEMGPFSPNPGLPPPASPYGPPIYPHPMAMPLPLPLQPVHHQNPAPQQHPNLYSSNPSPVPPFPIHQDAPGPYPMPPPPASINYPDPKPENTPAENYPTHQRDNSHRRGGPRRTSFSSRKPPCLFFPSGRCKNGDDCRFPHVLPENGAPVPHPVFPSARPGPPRPRNQATNGPNFPNLEAKLGNMAIRDDQPRQKGGAESSSRSHSSDAGNRPKFQQGGKHPAGGANANKKGQNFRHQQRVPNADEFPVLAGSVTPPTRNPSMTGLTANGAQSGPTAAQVLQAPAPRKDSKESSTRGTSPDPARGNPSKDAKADSEAAADEAPVAAPQEQSAVTNGASKVMSFAAAATSGAADVAKEVSVSA